MEPERKISEQCICNDWNPKPHVVLLLVVLLLLLPPHLSWWVIGGYVVGLIWLYRIWRADYTRRDWW